MRLTCCRPATRGSSCASTFRLAPKPSPELPSLRRSQASSHMFSRSTLHFTRPDPDAQLRAGRRDARRERPSGRVFGVLALSQHQSVGSAARLFAETTTVRGRKRWARGSGWKRRAREKSHSVPSGGTDRVLVDRHRIETNRGPHSRHQRDGKHSFLPMNLTTLLPTFGKSKSLSRSSCQCSLACRKPRL